MLTAFPYLTHGIAGTHYFKVQFPVGFLGALFDSLSFFVTIVIIRHAIRSQNSFVYVAHLSIDLVIAILATFWVLFVFSFSGWLVNIVETNLPHMAEMGVLTSRNERYQRMLVEAIAKPTDNFHNIYFGLIMGISAIIPTGVHLCMFFYSLILRKNITINSSSIKKVGFVFAIMFVISSFFILRLLFKDQNKKDIKFDTVYSGETIKVTYTDTNNSENDLIIQKTRTSCGCTILSYPKEPIKSQESYNIQASIDTVYKTGKITKRIYVYFQDKIKPLEINVRGKVLPQPDSHISKKDPGIFSQTCSACHANPGHGRTDFQLYLADCAVCHGIFRGGLSAPALLVDNILKLSDVSLANIIANGSADKNMPAFSSEKGGPLNDDQIKSLLKLLKEELPKVKYPENSANDDRGKNIYMQLCFTCHGSTKTGGIGPSIEQAGLTGKELINLLEDGKPNSVMVSFLEGKGGVLETGEVESLLQYFKSKGLYRSYK
jgi:mono/diheme cytochrome c family protein